MMSVSRFADWITATSSDIFPAGQPLKRRLSYAVSAKTWDLRQPLSAYLGGLYPDGKFPVRVLVQFDRETGKYNVDFEDTYETRWRVNPGNIEEMPSAVRPNFA